MAYVQSKKSYFTGNSDAVAFDGAVSTGSIIVVSVHSYGITASTITKSAGTATLEAFAAVAAIHTGTPDAALSLEIQYAYVTAGGTCTITCNPGGSSGYVSWAMHECSLSESESIVDQYDINDSATTAVSGGPITTTVATCLLFAAMTDINGTNQTINKDADYTQMEEYEDGTSYIHLNTQYRIVTSTLTDTANWTIANAAENIGWLVAFKMTAPPTGGATTVAKDRTAWFRGMMHGMRKTGSMQ